MGNETLFGIGGLQTRTEGQFGAFGQDPLGGALISQLLPAYAQLSAAGKLFVFDMSGGTGKIPVVAAPTTSPEWALYNFSEDETLIVLQMSATIISGTAGLGLGLYGAAALGPQTVISADYAGSIKTATNGGPGKPSAYLTNNPTLIGGTPAWFVWEGSKLSDIASVSIGSTITAKVDGALVAKPNGGMVAFETVAPTGTTATFDFSALIAMVKM